MNINVPLLVVHGELDTNVPLGEAHQIVAALEALGRPVDYLELEGEGHEYRRAASRTQLILAIVEFLTRHLDVRPNHYRPSHSGPDDPAGFPTVLAPKTVRKPT